MWKTMAQVVARLECSLERQQSIPSSVPDEAIPVGQPCEVKDIQSSQFDRYMAPPPKVEETVSVVAPAQKEVKNEPNQNNVEVENKGVFSTVEKDHTSVQKPIWIWPWEALKMLMKGRDKDSALTIFSPLIKKAEDLAFLENKKGLSSLEVIGRGGCGEVYKAELPGSNGKLIAIKKIIQPAKDAAELTEEDSKVMTKKMRLIKSEIQTVGEIRHRNLLPLLAHMLRPDCHYLVYEYMRNGSLQDLIVQAKEGQRELDWPTRRRIAVGIAAGLEYLQMHCNPRIIHRDLKPANVLLDDDMEARIADFGLAKAMPEAFTHVTSSNVVGTLGYIAPEYYQTLMFTDKCDIYSFGVLLAVLVMGKFPSEEFFQHTEEMNLVTWMRNVMTSEDPKRAIDPKLLGNGQEDQMLLVLKVACFCTLENPKERPNSKDVRCMLTQINQN